ncbi:hypothetical protein B0H21DRAFT_726688 [Amylocystis lapponica]|nr:hypothetical protein B0H21DRAFT_726688 [Amylocystis lapponica]
MKKFHHHVHGSTTTSYENRLIEYREKSLAAVWMPHLFSWMILAGFILLPGSLKTELDSDEALIFRSTPLYISGWTVAGLGMFGLCCYIYEWRNNCVYLLNIIFFPSLEHAVAGLLTTIMALYLAHHGIFTTANRTPLIIISVVAALCLVSTVWCWIVKSNLQDDDSGRYTAYNPGPPMGTVPPMPGYQSQPGYYYSGDPRAHSGLSYGY